MTAAQAAAIKEYAKAHPGTIEGLIDKLSADAKPHALKMVELMKSDKSFDEIKEIAEKGKAALPEAIQKELDEHKAALYKLVGI